MPNNIDETAKNTIDERKGLNKPPRLVKSLSLPRMSLGTVLNIISGIIRNEIIAAAT